MVDPTGHVVMREVYIGIATTGSGDGAYDELLELAVLDEDGAVLLESLVRPKVGVWPDAQRRHGIAPHDVERAPTLAELAPRIGPLLYGARVVGYFAGLVTSYLPAAQRTYADLQCAMQAFSDYRERVDPSWQWEDGRVYVSALRARYWTLYDAAEYALFARGRKTPRHRARADAERTRAVWRFLQVPALRARIEGIRAEADGIAYAKHYVDEWAARRDVIVEQRRWHATIGWMRWWGFPLWRAPHDKGRSQYEAEGWRSPTRDYHDKLHRLFTGFSMHDWTLMQRYPGMQVFKATEMLPDGLRTRHQLNLPPWALQIAKPCALRLSGRRNGRSHVLYRHDVMEDAYAAHPLRRPYEPREGFKLYARSTLLQAGFARAEIARLKPVCEVQRSGDAEWQPRYQMRVRDVERRAAASPAERRAMRA